MSVHVSKRRTFTVVDEWNTHLITKGAVNLGLMRYEKKQKNNPKRWKMEYTVFSIRNQFISNLVLDT